MSKSAGSSFVSGCQRCSAIPQNFTIENPSFNGNVHYSGFVFHNIVMLDGSLVKHNAKDDEIKIAELSANLCTFVR